jgi:hypothetical protein
MGAHCSSHAYDILNIFYVFCIQAQHSRLTTHTHACTYRESWKGRRRRRHQVPSQHHTKKEQRAFFKLIKAQHCIMNAMHVRNLHAHNTDCVSLFLTSDGLSSPKSAERSFALYDINFPLVLRAATCAWALVIEDAQIELSITSTMRCYAAVEEASHG